MITIEDFRLTPEGITDQFTEEMPVSILLEKSAMGVIARLSSRVANAATDKAIEKIVEYLMLNQSAVPISEVGVKVAFTWDGWQALKELIKEEAE